MFRRLSKLLDSAPPAAASARERHVDTPAFGPHFEQQLEALTLSSRRILRDQLRRKHDRKRRGSGLEFVEHREYVVGDDPRLLDWNATQRRGQLLLRVNEEPQESVKYVLLDTSASMGHPSLEKFRVAQQVAAALGYLFMRQGDPVMVGSFSEGPIAGAPPKRGVYRVIGCLRFLSDLRPQGLTQFSLMSRRFTTQYRRPGTVYLISDLTSPEDAVRATDEFRFKGHVVHWIHLIEQTRVPSDWFGDVTLQDSETGRRLDVTLNGSLIAQLESEERLRSRQLALHLAQRGVGYHLATTGSGFEQIVLSVLGDNRPPKAGTT